MKPYRSMKGFLNEKKMNFALKKQTFLSVVFLCVNANGSL